MRLQNLYKQLLEALNVYADDLGLLSQRRYDGQVEQINVSVDGQSKRLVLPHPELLRKGLPDELVAFHPLSEISNRGESEVLRKLKILVNIRLTTILSTVLVELTMLAADKDRRKALPPKLLTLLEALPHADDKLVANVSNLINGALSGGKNRLINIYLSRGGKYMGEKHARVAVVSFPILAELDEPDRKVYGVQLRAKDVPQIKALFDLVLPNSDTVGTYNACSDSMDAPNFEALMLGFVKVARQLNSIVKLASKYLEDAKQLTTDLEWVPELDSIEKMRFEIPALEGNKGIGVNSGKGDPEPEPTHNHRSSLDHLSSRASAAEPIRTTGAPTGEPKLVVRREIEEAPTSSIRNDFTVEDLRRINAPALAAPIVAGAPAVETPPTPGLRKMSEVMGQPVNPVGTPMVLGAYGAPVGYGAPPAYVAAPAYGGGGYGYNARPAAPSPFAIINAQAAQMHQPVNGGWGNSGWGNRTGF